jgi:6-phosphofructokinase 1
MYHEKENIDADLSKMSFDIKSLGKPIYLSPIQSVNFVKDNDRIIYNTNYEELLNQLSKDKNSIITFEKAGPRERIYFEPSKSVAGIVTCGGLCPGLNNVIRSIVMQLFYQYRVKDIIGIRYGYKGLNLDQKISPLRLNPDVVQDIHNLGGSILGSSRGYSDAVKIVDALEYYGINILFTIGGDGTIRGAIKIVEEIEKRDLKISVIGIPKTIDNDIPFISKTFGFETAFSEAVEAIRCAHAEAKGAPNGIGIVKVMGRDSGFIAAQASLAQKDVNYVLIPEIDFDLEGPKGLFKNIEERLKKRGHALIVIAEGSGQKYFEGAEAKYDASGNKVLNDIGVYLKNKLKQYFDKINMEVNIKYIDPSYIIRSVPASPNDSVYCGFLAENAVHAAMAGKTKMIIGKWNENFVHLPMEIVNLGRKKIDIKGSLWRSVILSTGQEDFINDK